jgi:hypothetical protein
MFQLFGGGSGPWEPELFRALVDIVRAGGFYAIMGIMIWCLAPIIKISIIGGLIWAAIRSIFSQVCNLYLLRKYSKGATVTLLSKQTSKHLENAITEWKTQCEAASKDMLNAVDELRKGSNVNSNGTKKEEPVSTNS